jgi:hypothetical protein
MALVEGYEGYIDPEHFEHVMDGVIDTVAGAESLNGTYTWAQNYLYGCLDASDVLKEQKIGGMENMITDGLKAMWDYIVRLFKNIWGFFFGSGDDSAGGSVAKAEKKVKENKAELEETVAPKNEEQVKKATGRIKAKAAKIKNDPKASSADKAKAEKIHQRIVDSATGKGNEPKGAAMREMLVELATATQEADTQKLQGALDGLDARVKTIIKMYTVGSKTDHAGEVKDTQLAMKYQGERNTLGETFQRLMDSSGYKALMKASTLDQLLAGQKEILTMLETAKANNEYYKRQKNDADREVGALKSLMSIGTPSEELKQKLREMKTWGSLIFSAKQQMELYVKACEKVSDALNVYAGVK